jgi:hypothetical protein
MYSCVGFAEDSGTAGVIPDLNKTGYQFVTKRTQEQLIN